MMIALDKPTSGTLHRLISVLRVSERRFYQAAEQVRNRGLKLLLKSYTQQRSCFAETLGELLGETGDEPEPMVDTGAVSRGWTDIQATMIVRRQVRQRHVLTTLANEEEQASQTFAQAIQSLSPPEVQEVIRKQSIELDRMQRQLRLLAEAGDQRVLVRLFNDAKEAKAVLEQLEAKCFGLDHIYSAPVEAIALYTNEENQRTRSLRETVITAAILGGFVGLVLGGILALSHRRYFPEVGGIFASTLTGVMIELLSYGTIIGAFFGTLFGFLIGDDAAEDDAYLYQESIQDGDTLVAVVVDGDTAAEAEEIMGLRHQFEVEPIAG